eukprot:7566775-Pyramimonas_sp.AAC.1
MWMNGDKFPRVCLRGCVQVPNVLRGRVGAVRLERSPFYERLPLQCVSLLRRTEAENIEVAGNGR